MQEKTSLTEWFLKNRPYARPDTLIAPGPLTAPVDAPQPVVEAVAVVADVLMTSADETTEVVEVVIAVTPAMESEGDHPSCCSPEAGACHADDAPAEAACCSAEEQDGMAAAGESEAVAETVQAESTVTRQPAADHRNARRPAGKRRGPGGHQAQKRHAQRQAGAHTARDTVRSSGTPDSGGQHSGDD